jgi:hypothetical protein
MKKRVFFLILLVAAAFLFYFLFQEKPPVSVLPPTKEVSPKANKPRSRDRPLALSAKYPFFGVIEKRVEATQPQFAGCFLQDTLWNHKQIEMKLLWDGAGKLQSLSSTPLLSPVIEECLTSLMSTWRIPAHPGAQPFSYSFVLELN